MVLYSVGRACIKPVQVLSQDDSGYRLRKGRNGRPFRVSLARVEGGSNPTYYLTLERAVEEYRLRVERRISELQKELAEISVRHDAALDGDEAVMRQVGALVGK